MEKKQCMKETRNTCCNTPMCTGVGSFLLLGLGGKTNQTELQKNKYHNNVHWCRLFLLLEPVGENQSEIKCRKGNLSTLHNESTFTQTRMHVI